MKDYRVEVKVKNNKLWQHMARTGYSNAARLSRESGVSYPTLIKYLNLKATPLLLSGEWSRSILQLAGFLRCMPEDLFPPQHLEVPLEKNSGAVEMSLEEVTALPGSLMALTDDRTPETAMMDAEVHILLKDAIHCLTEREQEVLNFRWGLDGTVMTLRETGARLGITKERIRQIEKRALVKLRGEAHKTTLNAKPIKAAALALRAARNG